MVIGSPVETGAAGERTRAMGVLQHATHRKMQTADHPRAPWWIIADHISLPADGEAAPARHARNFCRLTDPDAPRDDDCDIG
jgi:hypothetical protein